MSQFWNTVGRRNLQHSPHLTLIGKNIMMSQFSNFAVCSTNHYIWSSGVYI